jgi:hypothetical protein
MLNEILNRISAHLLSARRIAPLAEPDVRPSRWAEIPAIHPIPDSTAPEILRQHHLGRLTGLAAQPASHPQTLAQSVHALLNAATWSDTSAGDPFDFDPCRFDDAFSATACALACTLNTHRKLLTSLSPRLTERMEYELNRRVAAPLACCKTEQKVTKIPFPVWETEFFLL